MPGDQIRRMVGWRVWYRADTIGGSQFDSASTNWEDLPSTGVLQLVVYFQNGKRLLLQGKDYYWQEVGGDGELMICAENHASAILPADESVIKRGKWTSTSEMDRAHLAAVESKEAP